MATLTALNKKIAALEAQAERMANSGMTKAIAQIRRLMSEFGVTIEHLVDGAKSVGATVSKKSAVKKATTSKGKKPAKYRDPKSGATWSGLGRIPAWIAKAKSRDAFLIEKAAAPEQAPTPPAPQAPAKRAASKPVAKTERVVEPVAPKVAPKVTPKVAAKKRAAPKKAAAAKKAAAPAKAAAEPAPAAKAPAKSARKTAGKKKAAPVVSASGPDASATSNPQ